VGEWNNLDTGTVRKKCVATLIKPKLRRMSREDNKSPPCFVPSC
jgi:hypothetical protein